MGCEILKKWEKSEKAALFLEGLDGDGFVRKVF